MDKKIFIPKRDIIIYFLISVICINVIYINHVICFYGIDSTTTLNNIYSISFQDEPIQNSSIILFFVPEIVAIIVNIIFLFLHTKKQILEKVIIVLFNIFACLWIILLGIVTIFCAGIDRDMHNYNINIQKEEQGLY